MAVFRVKKNTGLYSNVKPSFKKYGPFPKSKGLLSLMLSLPDNWDYTTKGLACICKDA